MNSVPASVSVLAFVTTIHLALASLRNHRRPAGSSGVALTAISVLLGATPWLFPSPSGLALGLFAHLAWFIACEKLAPPARAGLAAPASPTSPRPPATTSATAVRSPSKPARPKDFVQVPVLTVLDESPDIKTFRLQRPEGFDFKPGQFLTVRVRADGKDHARCYSLSSPPEASGYLEISVKRQGVVSNTLHALMRPGSLMAVKAPAGAFTYPDQDDRPLVLIAGGVGITPLVSMARHALVAEPTRPVTLLYSAREYGGLAFRDELETAARRHPHFALRLAVTGGADRPDRPDVYPGRIDEALLRATVPDLAHSVVMMCGPGPMIDALRERLPRLGVPAGQIRFEVFEAAIAASASRATSERADVPGQPPPARVNGTAHRMTCARSGQDLPIAPSQTLLDAAEAAGLEIPSLCRAGVCGTCRTKVIEGPVDCSSDMLDDDDRRDGYVLACVTTSAGDCTVDV